MSHDVGDAHTQDDGDLHVCSLLSKKKYLNFCTTVIVEAKVKFNDCSYLLTGSEISHCLVYMSDNTEDY